jgi:hypothetical protein
MHIACCITYSTEESGTRDQEVHITTKYNVKLTKERGVMSSAMERGQKKLLFYKTIMRERLRDVPC